jgi:transposase
MVRPYSLDLRERVVARVEAGHSVREVAATFGVSASSVVKWSQRYRATGSAAAKPMGSRLKRLLLGQRAWLLQRIAEAPDITLRALVAELHARDVRASYGSLWRLLDDEGISFKKKPARQRAGSP